MGDFILTPENYYSAEANKHYMSNSLLKVAQECEYKFCKTISGEYERPSSDALLVGSYVDCALTEPENLEAFKLAHPEMISSRGATKGMLKSEFLRADQMIAKIKNDPLAMKSLDGEHQAIFTGNLFGVDFKCKLDVYQPHKAIVDLKTADSLRKAFWKDGRRVSFVENFNYVQQLAIYQELVFQNTGEKLPCYLLAVSKEPITDMELIYIDNESMDAIINGNEFQPGLAGQIESIRHLINGEAEPIKCGHCDLCLSEKKLTKPIHYLELEGLLD